MATKDNKILVKDVIENEVYEIGSKFGKSLDPANVAVKKFEKQWLDSISSIKKSALQYNQISKSFGKSGNTRDFIKIKQEEQKASLAAAKAYAAENTALVNLQKIQTEAARTTAARNTALVNSQKVQTEIARTEKERLIAASKKIDLEKKEEAAINKKNEAERKNTGQTEQTIIAYKEQARVEKSLITTKERNKIASEGTAKALIREREELRTTNLETRRSLTAMGQLISRRDNARKSVQEYQARLQLGQSLSDKEQSELKQSVKEFQRYDKAVKGVKKSTNEFQEFVGKYPQAFKGFTGLLKNLIPALGVVEGLKAAFNFAKESRQLAVDAKGVQFAFQRIEDRTGDAEAALVRVKAATRGLLSELDIQKAIVELDNFNISTQETDTLLEFLAVRAAQTGQSIDTLKQSLVEGLSKESKLRIDNLGISAKELNEELERTPNFVEAVANIAKKEIAEAGNILDEAQNSQAKWNADLKNFQLLIGNGVVSTFSNILYETGSNLLRLITPTKTLVTEIQKEQVELNSLVNQITDVNISNENRERLITELSDKYPAFLTFLKDEKTDNEALGVALDEINDAYVKRIALQIQQEQIEKILQKSGEKAFKVGKNQVEIQRELARINTQVLGSSIDLTNKSFEERIELIQTALESDALYSESINSLGNSINREARELEGLNDLIGDRGVALRQQSLSNKELIAEQEEMTALESALGGTIEEINALFSANTKEKEENTVATRALTDSEEKALETRLKLLSDDRFNLNQSFIQSEIEAEKNASENVKNSLAERQVALTQHFSARVALIELQKEKELEENKDRTDKLKEIELQYEDEIIAIKKQKDEQQLSLLKEQFDQELQIIKDAQQAKVDAENAEIGTAQGNFQASSQTPEDAEVYQKAIYDIKRKYALLEVQAQIDAINAVNTAGFSVKQVEEIESIKTALRIKYSNIETDQILENIEKKKDAEEKLNELKKELVSNFSENLSVALNIDAENLNVFFTSLEGMFDDTANGIQNTLQTLGAAASVTRDVLASVYQANVDELEQQRDASNEYYDTQFERAEGDKVQQDLIREEQKIKDDLLRKEIAKEKTKAAKADRVAAMIQAGVNTALAITAALTQPPPASFILAALSGALGLAQIALIASKPIPKFKDGHLSGTHEGWAITNDGGRDEVWERNGKAKVIKGRNVPVEMEKGDKIYKSVDDYKRIMRASMLASVNIENNNLKDYQTKRAFENSLSSERAIREEMALTRKEIQRSRSKITVNQTKPLDLGHELFRLRNLE